MLISVGKIFGRNTDLVAGQISTPAFSMLIDKIWSYRAIERTITDIRRTPSFDLGVSLQGKFDDGGNYGYNLMVETEPVPGRRMIISNGCMEMCMLCFLIKN